MSKEIANDDKTITLTAVFPGLWIPGSNPNYTFIKSLKSKLNNQLILLQTISWTMPSLTAGCTLSGMTAFNGGSGSMNASSIKCKCDGKLVMRKDDEGICTGTFTISVSPFTVPCSCTFKITNAGQIKVKGE